jgi:hypothetical protein
MCRYLAAVVRLRLRYLLRAYPRARGSAPHSCGQSNSLARRFSHARTRASSTSPKFVFRTAIGAISPNLRRGDHVPLMRSTGRDGPIESVATDRPDLAPVSRLTFEQPAGCLVAPALRNVWRQYGRDRTHDSHCRGGTTIRLACRTTASRTSSEMGGRGATKPRIRRRLRPAQATTCWPARCAGVRRDSWITPGTWGAVIVRLSRVHRRHKSAVRIVSGRGDRGFLCLTLTVALERWPRDGIPSNPTASIATTPSAEPSTPGGASVKASRSTSSSTNRARGGGGC